MDWETKFKKLMSMVGDAGCTFRLETNMNDVFAWGCAESGEVSGDDVEEVFNVYEKYDHWALIAYEVLRRGDKYGPAHGASKDPKYLAAKVELAEIAKDGTILFEQYWERTRAEREAAAQQASRSEE